MGAERRKDTRIRCAIPCQISGSGKPIDGTVRDVSAGGLSVQTSLDIDQGEVLYLVLQPDRHQSIPVQAIVWHNRQVKNRQTGQVSSRLGLVLSDAPDDFGDLLGLPTSGPPPSAQEAEPDAGPSPLKKPVREPTTPAAGLPKPSRFRVRVKMNAGPRSRSILVFAVDHEEARQSALNETGKGWSVLETELA